MTKSNTKDEELEELEFESNTKDDVDSPDTIHSPTDKDWNDFVLSQFTDDEKFHNNPTLNGLRRLTELLIGEIISITTNIVQVPSNDNSYRASAICSIKLLCRDDIIKQFDGAGDAFEGNVNNVFSKYLISMAESRSECRCLRRALRLKNVAAEELSDTEMVVETTNSIDNNTNITENQINFIDILCKRLNINVQKYILSQYPNMKKINELTYQNSLDVQKQLSEFQQATESIPETIKEYDQSWRNIFI
jgi:hypothetical protein